MLRGLWIVARCDCSLDNGGSKCRRRSLAESPSSRTRVPLSVDQKQGPSADFDCACDCYRVLPQSFIPISDGKLKDVHALDMLLPQLGAIRVTDRGYVDFFRLHVLHLARAAPSRSVLRDAGQVQSR
jgi:hypothetical protein